MILPLILDPNPILQTHCTPVRKITKELKELGKNLKETLIFNNGLGLAAPQVGRLERVIVILKANKPIIMYNPDIILQSSTRRIGKEKCLSFPGVECRVKRATNIKLRYRDINNKLKVVYLDGLEAICVQHEINHLDGITMKNKEEV